MITETSADRSVSIEPSPLIDVGELRRQLASSRTPALLDVRWTLNGPPGQELFAAGHLPGAHFVDLDRDLAGPPGTGGRHPLPDLSAFVAAMRRCGVSAGRLAVVYDQSSGLAAARCWWLLRYVGHLQVRLLDGGYDAWFEAGAPTTTDAPEEECGDLVARPGGMPVLDADRAARLARSGLLLDARAAERFRGEQEPVDPVAGHIPGAVSAPTTENLGAGRFRDPDWLRRHFASLGADRAAEVGAYCGSGVTAAHEVLALELAGYRGAGLYAGSWSEWIVDPDRPVATGE